MDGLRTELLSCDSLCDDGWDLNISHRGPSELTKQGEWDQPEIKLPLRRDKNSGGWWLDHTIDESDTSM